MKNRVTFPLKGARDYVHGTSVFDELGRLLVEEGVASASLDLVFHQMMHGFTCSIERRDARSGDCVVARLAPSDGDGFVLCFNPLEVSASAERVDYDEDAIARFARIDASTIASPLADTHSDAENMVALCKRLHLEHYQGQASRWVFSRYRGRIPLALTGDISISIVKSIGTRLTCSDVYSAGQKVGEIYFSCIA
ncbi:hypothetical protein QO207_07650 [Pseudomonas sp. CAN2814]|uniref:hypothetical protein n=1 Tax=Pseudomonas sp. CAN1 TaxID=3046726 RepID=UPI00264786E2|nr:hypothetical protein [Pseudomonas sp. CAN1]MDN6856457.1 hypothetical protein [Pseudomonas sp. CAN1]